MPTGLHIAIAVKVIPLAAIIQPVVLDVATVTVLIPFTRGIALPLTRSGHPDGLERKVADHGGRIKLVSRSISRDPIGKAHARLGGICRLCGIVAFVHKLLLGHRCAAIRVKGNRELLFFNESIGVCNLAIGRVRDGYRGGKRTVRRIPCSGLVVLIRIAKSNGRLGKVSRLVSGNLDLHALGSRGAISPRAILDFVGHGDLVILGLGSRNRSPLGRERDVAGHGSIETIRGITELPAAKGESIFGGSLRGRSRLVAFIHRLARDSTAAIRIEGNGVLSLRSIRVGIGDCTIGRIGSRDLVLRRKCRVPRAGLVVCIRLCPYIRDIGKRPRAILGRLIIGPEQGHRFRHVSGRAIIPRPVYDFIRNGNLILVIDAVAVLIGDTRSLGTFRRASKRLAHGCKRSKCDDEREADDERDRHVDQRLQLRAVQLVERHLFTPHSPDTCSFVI